MNLKQQREAALKAARDIAEKAKGENRELTADEIGEVDQHLAKSDDLSAQIKQAEESQARMKRLAAIDPAAADDVDEPGTGGAKSIGEHFVKHAGSRLAQVKGPDGQSRFSVSAPEYKAATDFQATPGTLAPTVTDIDTTIVQGFRRRLTIADLLAPGTLSGNAITYFVEGALEGDFATVAQGAAKPQLHYADPTAVTEALKKIAAFIKESDEMVEDMPYLASAINNRLLYNLGLFEETQTLSGNGTGTNLLGLLNRAGIQTETAATVALPGDDNADAIYRALTKVETATGLTADGIVINSSDYQNLRLRKDGNGQYFGGGFFQGSYGNGQIEVKPPLWGVPTVVTPGIAAGTVLVGAFKQSSTLYRKGGVRVEATNSNEDDFTKNKVTIRAEERVALAVRVPSALVKVTLDDTVAGPG